MKKLFNFPAVFLIIVVFFFRPFFLEGKLPIPSDTIIGLYHPFRDLYAKNFPRGVPFKNFLITDPVRQQYPWRELSISLGKKREFPLWNPYNFSGAPLLANFQSAAFYPLNILFFLLPFESAWSFLIFLQPLLAGYFLFLYLRRMNLSKASSFLGALTFSFCGFSVAWMEWNTIVQTALWLPLILLAKENLLERFSKKWIFVLLFAECSAVLAGHLQVLFYVFCISSIYLFVRIIQISRVDKKKGSLLITVRKYSPFLLFAIIVLAISFVQWFLTLKFISLSARDVDQSMWQQVGWFIPWQHLVQFLAPDFFGNPATLNYWGVFNYAEFLGYVGIIPLLFSFFALFFRHDKKTLFFGSLFFLSLLFALPTPFAKLPYQLNLPFISTAQPTRLLFVTDFSLSILAALGLDAFLKRKEGMLRILSSLVFLFAILWGFVLLESHFPILTSEQLSVAKHNMVFPTGLLLVASVIIFLHLFGRKYVKKEFIVVIVLAVTIFDLLRFSDKFLPFTDRAYLFPQTPTLSFLEKQTGDYRIMATDSRILPPNFGIMYKLQSVDGYDPLYLKRYAELIAASERNTPNISPPFGFNRIITPHNVDSRLIDLLGVKYVLSFSDISSERFSKMFEEGQTKVFENKKVLPRAFFVRSVQRASNKQGTINTLFDKSIDLSQTAVVENESKGLVRNFSVGTAAISNYSENKILIESKNNEDGFLVFTDTFYPMWEARIDGKITKIFLTDYNFRGILVPKGKHTVEFSLF